MDGFPTLSESLMTSRQATMSKREMRASRIPAEYAAHIDRIENDQMVKEFVDSIAEFYDVSNEEYSTILDICSTIAERELVFTDLMAIAEGILSMSINAMELTMIVCPSVVSAVIVSIVQHSIESNSRRGYYLSMLSWICNTFGKEFVYPNAIKERYANVSISASDHGRVFDDINQYMAYVLGAECAPTTLMNSIARIYGKYIWEYVLYGFSDAGHEDEEVFGLIVDNVSANARMNVLRRAQMFVPVRSPNVNAFECAINKSAKLVIRRKPKY